MYSSFKFWGFWGLIIIEREPLPCLGFAIISFCEKSYSDGSHDFANGIPNLLWCKKVKYLSYYTK